MIKYIAKRVLVMIPILIGVAILIFTLMFFVPGDPASIILGSSATQVEIDALRETMGLNKPFLTQLVTYLKDIFLHFDFGTSYVYGTSVVTDLLERFPRTLLIAALSIALSVVIGVPLGINAAVNANTFRDRISMIISLIGVSMPGFWLALMLVILFALNLGWLPASGIGGIQYYILPCLANALSGVAGMARQTRACMLEVIRSDYITTARAKGLDERKVLYSHALPNALIPIITVIGTRFGALMGGTLVIETIFSIPGIGSYMLKSINARDYAAVRGSIIFVAFAFSMVILLVDIIYAFVDPRIRAQYVGKKRKKADE